MTIKFVISFILCSVEFAKLDDNILTTAQRFYAQFLQQKLIKVSATESYYERKIQQVILIDIFRRFFIS